MRMEVLLGAAIALVGVYLLTRKAEGAACTQLQPNVYYYFTYVGPRKTVKAALGECYPVIYTIDIYDEDTDDWVPPMDPQYDILETGAECRVKVQGTCRLCGLERLAL